MEDTFGPGALAPQQVVIDTHRRDGVSDRGRRRGPAPARRAAAPRPRGGAQDRPRARPRAARRRPAGEPRRRRRAGGADPRGRPQRRRRGRGRGARAPHPRSLHPGGALPGDDRRAAHRRARPSVSTSSTRLRRVPVARARGARHLLPAAAARLPLGRPAAQGRDHEPALGERDLRRARARVRARLGQGDRAAELAADRGVDPDLPLRRALRPVDGLRGLPALAHARGVGPAATTTSTPSPTASSTPGASSPPARSS